MIALLLALSCGEPAPPPAAIVAPAVSPTPAPAPPPEPERVVLLAVGDVLPHRHVKASAAARGWEHVFGAVADEIRAADVAFANLEGPIAPAAHRGIYGEVFNAPASLADGLADAGFDVVSLANNHAWDQGAAGLVETLDHLDRAGLRPVGAGRTCDEARAPAIVEVRGIRVAFLAVADLLNLDEGGKPDAPCVFVAGDVCAGDCGPDRDAIHYRPDPQRILDAVGAVRADFVVLSFHWGDEYRTVPLPEYPALAETLVAGGVDVILGHHPHVLQPIARVRTDAGREGVVAYSLGNFVSNMAASYTPDHSPVRRGHTRDGGMLRVELVREPDGTTRVGHVALIPTWTENDSATAAGAPSVRAVSLDDLPDRELAGIRRAAIADVLGEGWLSTSGGRD